MKIYEHEESGSWNRTAPPNYLGVGEKYWSGSPYRVVEIDSEERRNLSLEFDHLEYHNTSVTVWLRKLESGMFTDSDGDLEYRTIPTTILYPMRMQEFEHVLRKNLLMKGRFSGTFKVNKKGNSISLELSE